MAALILGPIVGDVSHDHASLWARADGAAHLRAWIGQKSDLSDAAPIAATTPLTESGAFAGIVRVENLQPDTRYYYNLRLDEAHPLPSDEPFPSFQTFPQPGQPLDFNFAFGSCYLPYMPDTGRMFRDLEAQRQSESLRFLLMIGDQIYADGSEANGLGRIAIDVDDYRKVYTFIWSQPDLRRLMANIPTFMILDDHEVDNDWHWDDPQRRWAHLPFYERLLRSLHRRPKDEITLSIHRVRDAMQAYYEHQVIHGPAPIQPPRLDATTRFVFQNDDGTLAYRFEYGAASFFVMDTRTMRVEGKPRMLLGERQWEALEAWLAESNDGTKPKFLVSSSTLLFDMLADFFARDRWNGFPVERERLLHFIARNKISNLYVLSGDLHATHAISVDLKTPDNSPLRLWEFCASPFEQRPNSVIWTHIPVFSSAIRSQTVHFKFAKHNYGVVRVRYRESGPQVSFESRCRGESGTIVSLMAGEE